MELSADKKMGWRCFAAFGHGEGITGGAREIRVEVVEDGNEEEFLSVVQKGIQI
jgi:hypothetical protein